MKISGELCQDLAGRSACDIHNIEPVQPAELSCLEQYLRAVGRPSWMVPERCNLPFHTQAAKRRQDKQTSLFSFGTISNIFAVGRPIRLPVLAWLMSDTQGIPTADLLHPDVELSTTIGTVGDEAAVRGPSGTDLQSIIKGEACQEMLRYRGRNAMPVVDEHTRSYDQDECASP